MADLVLENIGGESCEPTAGIATEVFFAERSDFETVEDPKDLCGADAAATLEELVTIPAMPGHKLKTGKKWNKLDTVGETGELTTTQLGDKKRRLLENQISLQVAGSAPSLLGFIRWVKNKDLIFLIREVGTGNYRQLGSDLLAAWVETQEHKIEALLEGNNALTITIKDKQKWPAPIYLGDIDLTPVVGG